MRDCFEQLFALPSLGSRCADRCLPPLKRRISASRGDGPLYARPPVSHLDRDQESDRGVQEESSLDDSGL